MSVYHAPTLSISTSAVIIAEIGFAHNIKVLRRPSCVGVVMHVCVCFRTTSVLETTVPSLEEQLKIVRDKISDEATIVYMEKHYRSFMTKYSGRVDPEGAWLAYRLLVGKIAAVLHM
eukprot:scaffold34178_cov40-Prasinocladus_malaysianus.AAC.4